VVKIFMGSNPRPPDRAANEVRARDKHEIREGDGLVIPQAIILRADRVIE
jgi:hypothetical protein